MLNWPDYEIPTIELGDLFAEAGLDLAAALAKWNWPTIDEIRTWETILASLPAEIREMYGIEC